MHFRSFIDPQGEITDVIRSTRAGFEPRNSGLAAPPALNKYYSTQPRDHSPPEKDRKKENNAELQHIVCVLFLVT